MNKSMDFATYKKWQKLSYNDTNRLFNAFYANAYDEGKNEFINDCSAILTEERLLEILLSVKGIGKNRALQVIEKILNEGIDYGNET